MTVMLTGAVVGASRKLKEKCRASRRRCSRPRRRTSSSAPTARRCAAPPTRSLVTPTSDSRPTGSSSTCPTGMESGLEARHTYDHPYLTKPSADRKDLGAFYPMMGHGAHIPVVEVESGDGPGEDPPLHRRPRRGTIVNPKSLRGQISGGIAQGIGMALYEQRSTTTDGQPLTGELHGLPAADRAGSAAHRDRPRGDAVALHRVRREGRRRGRAHDRARRRWRARWRTRWRRSACSISELPMTPERLGNAGGGRPVGVARPPCSTPSRTATGTKRRAGGGPPRRGPRGGDPGAVATRSRGARRSTACRRAPRDPP